MVHYKLKNPKTSPCFGRKFIHILIQNCFLSILSLLSFEVLSLSHTTGCGLFVCCANVSRVTFISRNTSLCLGLSVTWSFCTLDYHFLFLNCYLFFKQNSCITKKKKEMPSSCFKALKSPRFSLPFNFHTAFWKAFGETLGRALTFNASLPTVSTRVQVRRPSESW